jgi:predicted flap endonuclease-1-like 5' DNA nuclease
MGIMNLTDIKGIGETSAKKLKKAGVTSIQDLREINIKKLERISGFGATRLQKWQKEARSLKLLSDIKGIGPTYQLKLEKLGITTIENLAQANHRDATDIGVSQKRFTDWLQQAKVMVGPSKPVAKKAVVAENIDEHNTAITVKGKIAQVKIKEKVHNNVPVFRGAGMEELAINERIAVHLDSTGVLRLWFNQTWHDNIPFSEENLWQRIKRMITG